MIYNNKFKFVEKEYQSLSKEEKLKYRMLISIMYVTAYIIYLVFNLNNIIIIHDIIFSLTISLFLITMYSCLIMNIKIEYLIKKMNIQIESKRKYFLNGIINNFLYNFILTTFLYFTFK